MKLHRILQSPLIAAVVSIGSAAAVIGACGEDCPLVWCGLFVDVSSAWTSGVYEFELVAEGEPFSWVCEDLDAALSNCEVQYLVQGPFVLSATARSNELVVFVTRAGSDEGPASPEIVTLTVTRDGEELASETFEIGAAACSGRCRDRDLEF